MKKHFKLSHCSQLTQIFSFSHISEMSQKSLEKYLQERLLQRKILDEEILYLQSQLQKIIGSKASFENQNANKICVSYVHKQTQTEKFIKNQGTQTKKYKPGNPEDQKQISFDHNERQIIKDFFRKHDGKFSTVLPYKPEGVKIIPCLGVDSP